MKGLFIAIEGIDYAGKDIQTASVLIWLRNLGYRVCHSSEPSDNGAKKSPLGITIRRMLKDEMAKPSDSFEFQRMYVLDRGQDIFCYVKPAIDQGDIYLINRYGLSTIAYGMLSGIPPEKFIQLHKDVLGSSLIWPNITILIDIASEEAMRRLGKTRNDSQFFEKKEKLEKVRQNYLSLVHHPYFKDYTIVVVNGEQYEEKVFEDIKKVLEPKLPPLPPKRA